MTVSVIIPAWNAEACLSICLESVFCQTLPAYEIIVVNDGSSDKTASVSNKYGQHIIYLEQENAGQGAARNAGLSTASGDFIAFLDADDFWKPQFLEYCCDFLNTHPEAIAVNTGLITRDYDGTETTQPEFLCRSNAAGTPFIIDDFYAFWAAHDHVRTGSAVIRKRVIDQAGGQRADLRVSQDLEYWGYIATFGKWGYIPEPLWVGNSRAAASVPGWLRKYRERRRLCPTIESWQERILPRLSPDQMPNFTVVRGRVAAGYSQNHILGGNPDNSWHIVKTYGDEMPDNRLTRLLKFGNRHGATGWWVACRIVRLREFLKAVNIRLRFSGKRV